jgi:hypothetical protein
VLDAQRHEQRGGGEDDEAEQDRLRGRRIMLTLLTQSIANASFGIYFPRFSGTIYEILSAPISPVESTITTGCSMRSGTNSEAVARMMRPSRIDFEAAAPT